MKKEFTSEDIIRRRHYADLNEWGDFYASYVEVNDDDLEDSTSVREFRVYGTWRRWFRDAEDPKSERLDDPIEARATLEIALLDPVPAEEAQELSPGELFSLGWDAWTVVDWEDISS